MRRWWRAAGGRPSCRGKHKTNTFWYLQRGSDLIGSSRIILLTAQLTSVWPNSCLRPSKGSIKVPLIDWGGGTKLSIRLSIVQSVASSAISCHRHITHAGSTENYQNNKNILSYPFCFHNISARIQRPTAIRDLWWKTSLHNGLTWQILINKSAWLISNSRQ